MAILQGFEEVDTTAPITNVTMTVMESRIRFNKATAAALSYPAYVKVLVNDKTKQIALKACSGRDSNAVKFSKPEGKQRSSVTVRDRAVLGATDKFFTLKPAPAGKVSYQAVSGKMYAEEKVVVFDAREAKAGTMQQRGHRATTETKSPRN